MNRFPFLLTLLAFSSQCLWGAVNQNNDVQLWVTEAVVKQISPRCWVNLANEWRFGDDVSKLYFFFLQQITVFKINDWSQIGPGYRQVWRLEGVRWTHNYEPLIDLFFHTHKGNLELQMRNRFAYIFREVGFNTFQYRCKIRAASSWTVRERVFQPYVSNEIFLESPNGFTQERLTAGIVLPFFNHFNGDFYYMLRFLKSNHRWTHQHVFGTWFNIYF